MLFWKGVFILGICIVVYNYIGYVVIAFLLTKIVPKFNQKISGDYFPSVSFIVAAYNEEEIIEKKIRNSLSQVYSPNQIESAQQRAGNPLILRRNRASGTMSKRFVILRDPRSSRR